MRSLCTLFLLLTLALPAQTIVSALGDGGWDAYPAYINAKSYAFDFHDMAGTTDGALTISTSGVADIASKGISGTPLSSFAGATYRWQSSTWSVSLKLDVCVNTFLGKISIGTLVYSPGSVPTDWTETTINAASGWRFTTITDGNLTPNGWDSYLRENYHITAMIGAIELGLGTSTPTDTYTGSVDWIDYSILSSAGTLTTTRVDFASPIPEPATAAAVLGACSLGMAAILRRRKQRS